MNYLKDSDLEKFLIKNGYVIIPSFLNSDEINFLVNLYERNISDKFEGIYATAHEKNLELRKLIFDEIDAAFDQPIKSTFNQITPLGGSFVVKYPGEKSHLEAHQDWSHVDEDKYRSFNLWVPLTDLNQDNGAIMVMPKSHLWLKKTFRHVSIPSAYNKVKNLIWDNMIVLDNMKKGDALFYDHRLLHGSFQNNTKKPRLAIAFGTIEKGAQLKIYWNENGKIEEYDNTAENVKNHNINIKPEAINKTRTLNYSFPEITAAKFWWHMGKPIKSLLSFFK
jgi:hypothetical protein